MTTMTLTGKGQFTLNKLLLKHLGIKPGEKVLIRKLSDGSLKIEAERNQIDISSLAGLLRTNVSLSNEELENAIRKSYTKQEPI
jgi:bifunctional DNA-binding transcriptional regulator/antitoxin component of YhaV-PrlF toxin-antitoxin module